MTMLSFRIDDDDAARVEAWAERLGIDRSELIRQALHGHLARLAKEVDVAAWSRRPMTESEAALGEIADWGPAEDWSDWADGAR